MNIKYQTIKEVNEHIEKLIESDIILEKLIVRGEVANITDRGHIYMTLKDQSDYMLKAVLFKSYRSYQSFIPKIGDDILLYGAIELYAKNGTYQLIVKDMMLYGDGARLLELERLRKALQEEGLFDDAHKLPIPKYPNKIAIVTSESGAAIHDIVKNIMIRFPIVKISHFNALVQGEEAPKDLIRALNLASKSNPDIIILGRGGGDKEDLSAFNDEQLVRTIFNLKIPLISAVGHESDYTLVDYVADLRASTPTDAAIKATPRINDILLTLDSYRARITRITSIYIQNCIKEIEKIKTMQFFKNPESYFETLKEKINTYQIELRTYFLRNISKLQNQLDLLDNNLSHFVSNSIKTCNNEVKTLKIKLETLNPKNILNKGYSLTIDKNGKLITSISDVYINDKLKTILKDGIIESNVIKKE